MSGLIDPSALAGIQDLELAGRLIAEGYLSGLHPGARLGHGIEFAQYRSWEPGEESRFIDWRLFARTEKMFVRQSELDTDFRLWLLLDYSASMQQKSVDGALSKFEYARFLAAGLGYLAQHQNDQLGLIGLGSDSRVFLPAESGRDQWYRLLTELERMSPVGQIEPSGHLPANLLDATEGSLVIAISDFYQLDSEWVNLLQKLTVGNREVIAVCLECQDELQFEFAGSRRFVDPESRASVSSQSDLVRESYLEARESFLQDIKTRLAGSGIEFVRFNVDQPMDRALRDYLRRRQAA
jgi:uncharacterized protein (DUF58 family)